MIEKKQVYGEIPGLPLSGAVRAGDFVFVSGQVPFDEDGKIITGDITTQTVVVMERIKTLLHHAGCQMEDIVKCNC